MEPSLTLMNNMLHKIRSEGRGEAESWKKGEREKQKEVISHASPSCKSDIHI